MEGVTGNRHLYSDLTDRALLNHEPEAVSTPIVYNLSYVEGVDTAPGAQIGRIFDCRPPHWAPGSSPERSVTNTALACQFRRNDELRGPLCEVRLASMYSSGPSYLMPRGSNSWLVHRASSREGGQPPVVFSAPRGGVILPSVSGQHDPLARLVIEAPHVTRLVEGVEQNLVTVNRRGDLHELRFVCILVAHLTPVLIRS